MSVPGPTPPQVGALRYATNLVPALQRLFPSANSALAWLKENGIGVRRQNFLWEWGAQLKADATKPALFSARLESLPSQSHLVERRSPQARGYHLIVEHLIEDPDSGELYWTFGGWRGQQLVSYAQMIAEAESAFLEGQSTDERYPQGQLLGSRSVEVRRYLEELPEDEGV